jgi:hypothetical protein
VDSHLPAALILPWERRKVSGAEFLSVSVAEVSQKSGRRPGPAAT